MCQKLQFRLCKLLLWTTLVAVSLGIVRGLGIDPAVVGANVGGGAASPQNSGLAGLNRSG
jgi:hypothetical protein